MRTRDAARYARWAATAALLVALGVAGVYVYRAGQAARLRQQAPAVVPPPVKQRTAEFAFSKVEGERTLFTVRASRQTEYKEGSRSILEDVWITIYGRTGGRFDNIHTRSCDYKPESGRIVCAGEVQIDLESAEEARQRPGQRVLHLRTTGIAFDRSTGEAHSDHPVVFQFPYGQGRGVGVTYSTRDATVRLHRDVEATLVTPGRASGADQAVVLTSAGLTYQRNLRTLHLLPPVRVRQGPRELTAGGMALEFDAALRARRLRVTGEPKLHSREPQGDLALAAREFLAFFNAQGGTERVVAEGEVEGSLRGAAAESRLRARRLELVLDAARNEPREATASGDVAIETRPARGSAAVRRIETDELRTVFAPDAEGGGRRVARAETGASGTITLSSPEETTRVRGSRLAATFDPRSRIERLAGRSGVEVERSYRGAPAQVSQSRELEMGFGPGGEWAEVEQRGQVRFREGSRTAEADRARLVRATDRLTLAGGAAVADGAARITADAISIHQRSGNLVGEGNVRTRYAAAGAAPVHLSADRLEAHRDAGRALYSGRARMWQDDAVIEAETIEVSRDARQLEARGGVQGLFPQAAGGATPGGPPAVWRFHARSLRYEGTGRARLEGDVRAESRVGQITSRAMDLHFAAGPGGAQRLARALAFGGVNVRQGTRRGVAERAEYVAAEEKFVLSGGTPTLSDATRGTTTGRQLTFFLADDKILIDADEGSRTLTRHRVEK